MKDYLYKKLKIFYSSPFVPVIIIMLLFISFFSPNIRLVALSIVIFLFLITTCFVNFQVSVNLLLFVFGFWSVGGKYLVDINWYYWASLIVLLVLLTKYAIEILKKTKRIPSVIFLLNVILIVLSFINLNFSNILQLYVYFSLFLWGFLFFVNSHEFNLNIFLKNFIFGMLFSIIISSLFLIIPGMQSMVVTSGEWRFQAFMGNPNQLSESVLVALSFIVFLFFKNKIKIYPSLMVGIILIATGLATKSKTFLLGFVFLIFLICVLMIIKYKKKGLYYTLGLIITLGIVGLIFNNKIAEIIKRFNLYEYDSILDIVTTGRWSIIVAYLKDWSSSALTIAFGRGATANPVVPDIEHPHNLYVKVLTDFGLIGLLIISMLMFFYFKADSYKLSKKKLSNIVPLLICMVIGMAECLIGSLSLLLVLSIVCLFSYQPNYFVSENLVTNRDKIKVLHIMSSINASGGVTQVVKNYTQYINKSKFQFDIAYFNDTEIDLSSEFIKNNVELYKFNKLNLINYTLVKNQIIEILKKSKCDIVHLHMPILHYIVKSAIEEIEYLENKNIKLIQHAHASKLSSYFLRTLRNKLMLTGVCSKTDKLMACSKMAGNKFFGNKFKENGEVMPNAIDFNRFTNNKMINSEKNEIKSRFGILNEKVYCHVGRLCKEKNQNFVLDIFIEILKKEPNSKLLFVGGGEENYIDILKRKIETNNISHSVIFANVISDIENIYAISDILIFPSLYEGLGIVLIEAQSSNVLCFASDKCPIESKISNLITYISLSKSANEWANIVLNTTRPEKVEVNLDNYDINTAIKRLEKIYEDLV